MDLVDEHSFGYGRLGLVTMDSFGLLGYVFLVQHYDWWGLKRVLNSHRGIFDWLWLWEESHKHRTHTNVTQIHTELLEKRY